MQLGVGRGRLATIRFAATIHPRQLRVCHDGIDERYDGAAVTAEEVGNARGHQGLAEEFGSGGGAEVLGDYDCVIIKFIALFYL